MVDEKGCLLRAYRVVGRATTVFVTRTGRIFRVHPGPFLGTEGARHLEETIVRLLE